MKLFGYVIFASVLFGSAACSSKPVVQDKYPLKEFPVSRQSIAPYPTYGTTTWVHDARPMPLATRVKSPLIMPVIEFSLKNSNLSEAIEALAQTIGYEGMCPSSIAKTKVSIDMAGTIENILEEISRQAKVDIRVNYKDRTIQVVGSDMAPTLPIAKSSS